MKNRRPSSGGNGILTATDEALRGSDEVALRRRVRLEALVASISRRLLGASAETLDTEIVQALNEMAHFADAERCFLYRCGRDVELWENTHEWCAPHIDPLPAAAGRVTISNYPWSFHQLKCGDIVRFNEQILPPEADGERNWLRHGGMGSALVLPLMVRGQLVGCVGLNATRSDQQWQDDDLDCLRTASEIVLQAVDRQRAEREQNRQAERLNAQNAVLEMIARGRPLTEVLTGLARLIEDQYPTCASMLFLAEDESSATMRGTAFGPNMPTTMARAMDVISVAADGTISDPAAPEVAAKHGFKASTSTPIISRSRAVLGTFALYFKDSGPTDESIQPLVDTAVYLAAVAIDHWHNEQRTLRANDALLRLIEHAPIAIISFGVNRRVNGWNPAAERIFGWTAEEAIGRPTSELIVPPDQLVDHEKRWDQLTASRTLQGVEVTRCRKDGSLVEIASWTSLVTSPDERAAGTISFVAEISEQKRLKDQLLRSSRMESIGRLAGGVAHDFNNLLAVISGYSESMLRRTDAQHPLRSHVEEIYRAATRGAALTQQLLAFSRRQRVAPQKMDLSQSVQSVYGMMRRVITRKIDIDLQTPNPVDVMADPGQVEQVLVNLAINARDAMPDGGRLVICTESVTLTAALSGGPKPGRYGHLTVTDTGIGMNAETCARIFEPFFSTKNHPKEGAGTGLGLSIVYGIVQQAGGHIAVRSAPDQGTRFDVYFPCERV